MHEQFVDKPRAVLPARISDNAGETSGAGNNNGENTDSTDFQTLFLLSRPVGFPRVCLHVGCQGKMKGQGKDFTDSWSCCKY